jgi:hypothetical protein
MRPEAGALRMLSTTRAKAKMFEFRVPRKIISNCRGTPTSYSRSRLVSLETRLPLLLTDC